jgi:hypothetical protein
MADLDELEYLEAEGREGRERPERTDCPESERPSSGHGPFTAGQIETE